MFGCTKESTLLMNEMPANERQLSTMDAFKVGELDGNGNANITYNMTDLQEICACSVFEDQTTGLQLTDVAGFGYFLSGEGTSSGSHTTFKVKMTLDGNDIMWENEAHVAMCQTSSSTPCDLTITGEEDFTCDNGTQGSCNEDETGGGSGFPYASCGDTNWPWVGKKQDKK